MKEKDEQFWLVEVQGDCDIQFHVWDESVKQYFQRALWSLSLCTVAQMEARMAEMSDYAGPVCLSLLDVLDRLKQRVSEQVKYAVDFIQEFEEDGWGTYKFGVLYDADLEGLMFLVLFLAPLDETSGRLLIGDQIFRVADDEYVLWFSE